jgi:hypothetical protein
MHEKFVAFPVPCRRGTHPGVGAPRHWEHDQAPAMPANQTADMGTHTTRNVVAAAMTAATAPTGEKKPNERDIEASVKVWFWSPRRAAARFSGTQDPRFHGGI